MMRLIEYAAFDEYRITWFEFDGIAVKGYFTAHFNIFLIGVKR